MPNVFPGSIFSILAKVIGNETIVTSFKSMIQNFEQEYDTSIGERFDIFIQAVKKQSSAYKTVLKLDKTSMFISMAIYN